MAAHSSILAWRIPWTKDLGGLQSMGLQELDMSLQLNNDNSKLDYRLLFMTHLYFFYCYETVIENEIFYSPVFDIFVASDALTFGMNLHEYS